jgi:hypothetical protein
VSITGKRIDFFVENYRDTPQIRGCLFVEIYSRKGSPRTVEAAGA